MRKPRRTLTGSVTQHPLWPLLRPFVVIELYGRDTSRLRTRFRIEIKPPAEGHVLRALLAISMPCVICGQLVHPVRMRAGRRSRFYYSPTCPLEVNRVCRAQRIVTEEYARVRRAVEAWQRGQAAPPPATRHARQGQLPL